MKKSILLCALVISAGIAQSQSEIVPESTKKLKFTSFGLEVGMMNDRYAKMDLGSMYDLTKNPALLDRDLSGHVGSFYRNSGGSRLGFNATFTPYSNTTGSYRTNHEVRFGAFYSSREPLISYDKNEADGSYSSIIYCNMVNEFSVNGAYLVRKSLGKAEWFNVYAGLGASIGSSFNDKMVVMEFENNGDEFHPASNTTSFYDGKSSFFSRVYAPVGLDVTILKTIRIGVEGTVGVGMQNAYGGSTYFMPIGGAVVGKLAWIF